VEEINERILKMIIKVHTAEFVIIAVYGQNEDATDGENDDFYVHIRDISRKIISE
jgi:UDP-glucose 4-epimerase